MSAAAMIQTVTGPVPAESLGHCQVHEHLIVLPTPASAVNGDLCFDAPDLSERELLAYKAAGGCALADAQPVGAGRDASALLALAQHTGVFLVASTGYHLEGFYAAGGFAGTEEELYERYVSEMTEGLQAPDGTRVKALAGLVKAAIPKEGPVGPYETHLRAAARAAERCGRALMLHTEAGQNALAAVDRIERAGLPPERVLLCHADRNAADHAMHLALARRGVYLEYDTVARPKYHGEEEEWKLLHAMLEAGYEDRLLLSLDTTRARLRAYGGRIGLDYLLTTYLPWLRSRGLSPESLHTITVENPARALSLRP